MTRNLKLVRNTHRVVDITALLHADIPDAEHWRKVHEAGDKPSRVVELGEVRGGWRA